MSGSGKSTLAFDTLYAEGQRRYVASLSTYARQFLERLEKPEVDVIEGLSPAIAIEQRTASHNPRSTVGTVTEIHDYIRLLYARIGIPHCHGCGRPITAQTVDGIIDSILALGDRRRLIILAPLVRDARGNHEGLIKRLRRDGFARVRVDGKIREVEKVGKLAKARPHTISAVVDRLVLKDGIRNRLADSLELALSMGEGMVDVLPADDDAPAEPIRFAETPVCASCGISYPDLTPRAFSFNSPQGACPRCDGLGTKSTFDPDRIVPDPSLSLREGAVVPWANRHSVHFAEFLDTLTARYGGDVYTPFRDLPEALRETILYGSGDESIPFEFERKGRRYTDARPFEGVIPRMERQLRESEASSVRAELSAYMSVRPCPECDGTRLNPAARSVRVDGRTMAELTALSVAEARSVVEELPGILSGAAAAVAERIVREIGDRLGFLIDVGLGYLTLDRAAHTLSGGESQRIRLATQIGARLTGVLYVLDEPSIGLHQRDNRQLISALTRMRDLGNTVCVVEHDEETIRSADHVVDMGPGAGIEGGRVVYSGPPEGIVDAPESLTGQYFAGRRAIEIPATRRPGGGRKLIIRGASANNLKEIDVAFPLGCLIGVTGVSGSGKSSLVVETLHRILARRINRRHLGGPPGAHREVTGLEWVDRVINIDQSPIGRTPRSNPATYTGLFTPIRELFAKTPDARVRGYKSGRFSFNVKGGRCEACGGDGIIKIEMHFLPDLYVTCDVCRGKRYNRETLEIRYRGQTIADVLEMTVSGALAFFERIGAVRTKLATLADVGLGYVRLGQPATTLSGGEAQRVKLSRELSKRETGRTVYILDEPTTGLHIDDVRRLLEVLNRLVEMGNTVIVIEHNLDVIKSADHLIDLGPEGGDNGGRVVGCGTPEDLAALETSHTGQYLRRALGWGD